jgi:hypothetical protein
LYTLCTTAAPANRESRATLYALKSSGTAIALPLLADLSQRFQSMSYCMQDMHCVILDRMLDAAVTITKLLTGQGQVWP